jgi:hypothetical protein
MDPYLTARSLATPCMVLALAAALDLTSTAVAQAARRRAIVLCLASLALATAMHPLMAAYAAAATLLLVCARSPRRSIRLGATATLIASALIFAALSNHVAPPETAAYLRIAATRTYWFPAQWRWYELIGLAAPLTLLAIAAWSPTRTAPSPLHSSTPEPQRALARAALIAGLTAVIAAILFARTAAPTHRIARLQPLREFQAVYLIMILVLGAKLGELILRRTAWRWCAAVALLASPMFLAARATFPNSPHIELQIGTPTLTTQNPWLQAFLWIRDHTPKDAFFALDADYINAPGEDAQCFRAIAERSALPDYSKDGGEASIAPLLTAAWSLAQTAQQNLSSPTTTDAARNATLSPLGVTWLVLQRTAATNLDCPYRNSAIQVCRLR